MSRRRMLAGLLSWAGFLGTFSMAATAADDWPSRPIRLIVPYAAGGVTDAIARVLTSELSTRLGATFVIDNRAGASGTIGTDMVAKSKPDGYTLVLATSGSMAINIQLMAKPPYDPFKELAPVTRVANNDGLLVVNPDFPARDFTAFLKVVRAAPGKYSYGSSGVGGPAHLGGELLKLMAGLDMAHIPYKGDGPAMTDVIGGTLPIMVTVLASVAPQVRAGQLRVIAAMGPERFAQLPDLPTVAEMGYPDFSSQAWIALMAPAGTSPAVLRRISDAWRDAARDPEVRRRFLDMGAGPSASTPEELAAYMRSEYGKWGRAIKAARLTAE